MWRCGGRDRDVTILWDFLFAELCRTCGTGGEILTRRFAFQTLAEIMQTIKGAAGCLRTLARTRCRHRTLPGHTRSLF
jgi:hypothetical protein